LNKRKENSRIPLIIIISSPSGGGKTTIVKKLVEEVQGLKRSVSRTTREPRDGEKNNIDYVFLTRDAFEKCIEKNEFLEWEEKFGNYYGTALKDVNSAIDSGMDIVLSIDVSGARAVKAKLPESIGIFIMPPSARELEERLKKRNTERKEEVTERLDEARREIKAADEYDYMIVNDNVERAAAELKIIIEKERKNRKLA